MAEKYTVIATNRGGRAEEVVQWYNQRGQCSENRIKELKIGFGLERMPCGQFEANAVFFRIGVLAYNVGRWFVCPDNIGCVVACSSGTDTAVETL